MRSIWSIHPLTPSRTPSWASNISKCRMSYGLLYQMPDLIDKAKAMLIRFPWLHVGHELFGWQADPVVIITKATNTFGLIKTGVMVRFRNITEISQSAKRVLRAEPKCKNTAGLISQCWNSGLHRSSWLIGKDTLLAEYYLQIKTCWTIFFLVYVFWKI